MDKNIKAVIFDFFDVLHSDYQKKWLAMNGYERDGEFAAASNDLDAGKTTIDEYMERYAAADGRITAGELREVFNSLSELNTAVVELAASLKQRGYKTALISNSHGDELRPLLKKHNLYEMFDMVVISAEVGIAKPNSAIFTQTLESLQIQAEEAIFIDDNKTNVAAATALGMTGILYHDADSLKQQLDSRIKLQTA